MRTKLTFRKNKQSNKSIIYKASLPIAFLLLSLFLHSRESLEVYWQVGYAFFVAFFANLFGALSGPLLLRLLKLSSETIKGMALAKFSEALVIIASIIVLIMIAGIDIGSIYLQVGNLPLGLAIGLMAFSLFAIIAFLQVKSFKLGSKTLISLLLRILTFVFFKCLHGRAVVSRDFLEQV